VFPKERHSNGHVLRREYCSSPACIPCSCSGRPLDSDRKLFFSGARGAANGALAQLAYAASEKGDNVTAATLAKILERTGDQAEDYGRDTALSETNHAVFEDVDTAMDSFLNTLFDHHTSAPDPSKVKAVYLNYLEKRKLAH
jgi:beta-mannanase